MAPVRRARAGRYTLRGALKVSSNRAAAQLLQQIGVGVAVYYAQRLGIESQLPMVPSLALGTGEVTLLELTTRVHRVRQSRKRGIAAVHYPRR